MTSALENNWQFQKTVYWDGHQLPGTGAKARLYGDIFFCTVTLDRKLMNRFEMGNTYQKPLDGSAPIPDDLRSQI